MAMTRSSRSTWPTALTVTLLVQIAVSFLSQSLSVLAPSLTAASGVSPEQIGWLASLVAFGTVWFLMGGNKLLVEIGAVRLLQLGVLLSASALLLASIGFWPATLMAALLVGLGYGPAPPAGSQILMDTVPKAHRSLIFSIKQSGAPVGSALAGFLLPMLAEHLSWSKALAIAACLAGSIAFLVEPFRVQLDTKQSHFNVAVLGALFSPKMLITPFEVVREAPGLRHLASTGFALAVVQGSLFALYVTYLVTTVGTDLAAAGTAFATVQLAGATARVAVGWLADRVRSPLMIVTLLGIASSATMLTIGFMQLSWSWSIILVISALAGFCAAGWNGVLMSEIARFSLPDHVGQTTSAATFFIFIGYVLGPVGFATIVQLTSSYSAGFSFLAIFPMIGSTILYFLHRRVPNDMDRCS